MGLRLFVAMNETNRRYFENPLLSSEAASKFPASDEELSEAGKCFALDRTTACVYHSMRALEVGLKAMAGRLGLGYDNKTWGTIIREIEAELSKRKSGDPFVDFCSEAATNFRFVKNAWRDHTMHARQNYTPDKAEAIMKHSAQLLEDLTKAGLEQI